MTPFPTDAETVLLPCPFCGAKAEVVQVDSAATFYPYAAHARCTECHQSALGWDIAQAKAKAAEAWNRRTP